VTDSNGAPRRLALDMRAIALLLLLCTIWGVQQVVMTPRFDGEASDLAYTI
jgi:hypothetical protein